MLTYVDYSAAFDTVSHKFLDKALAEANAPIKVRAMFRAVYSAASAFTTVPKPEGKRAKSDVFKIRRGVVQGDITSPLYFILALELIMRRHDAVAGKGVPLAHTMLHTLGYADDISLIDAGDEDGTDRTTTRLTSIAKGSKRDADMEINIAKTKAQHVREQDQVSKTTNAEASKLCKFVCPHLNCNFRFYSKRGLQVHMGKCKWKNDFEIEKILECKGPVCVRRYLVKWKGYQETTWEPRVICTLRTLPHLKNKTIATSMAVWAHRCPTCDLPFSSQRAIKINMGRYHKSDEATKEQDFSNRLADRAVRIQKLKAQQSTSRPAIYCNEVKLENVFNFVYLGTLLSADGNQAHDIKRRIALATTQCGKLRHIFDSNNITLHLKLRLYKAAVCSVLMFGCETWMFDMKTMRQINGINSLLLARITGNSAAHEARPATTSFNLVK